MNGKILAVDDDFEIRSLLSDFLTNQGYDVTCLPSAPEAVALMRSSEAAPFDLVISDLKMTQMDGMQFLSILQRDWPEVPVILITGHASIDTAIEAIQNGAFHYLVKPFKLSEVAVQVTRALEKRALSLEVQTLRKELRQGWGLSEIIGKSQGMRAVFDLIERVAPSTANVLIQGESGTGKEMVARAIHAMGPRAQKPFIAINCTAIPETLLESELFGHAKGAFTGAAGAKRGLIEEAEGGTLFLDEIGDMSPTLQSKLLRVLQERKIRPVGSNTFVDVDVRVITATHKDLRAGIEQGSFREDLFYRLSVIPILVPPLRERQEDILLLAEHFLKRYAAANGVGGAPRVRSISKAALGKLLRFRWQGNVRELENIIERAVVLAPGAQIEESDLPEPEVTRSSDPLAALSSDLPTLTELEDRYIRMVLLRTAGRKERAAQILGVNRRTLYRKEREYGLVDSDAPEEELIGNA